jgi:hypothetical protein
VPDTERSRSVRLPVPEPVEFPVSLRLCVRYLERDLTQRHEGTEEKEGAGCRCLSLSKGTEALIWEQAWVLIGNNCPYGRFRYFRKEASKVGEFFERKVPALDYAKYSASISHFRRNCNVFGPLC